MNSRKQLIGIVCIAIFCSSSVFAQDVFTFVAGKKAPNAITGDFLHQYDYWIKPSPSSQLITLQIFDAGLGGIADVVTGTANTKTTFQLFPFDSLSEQPVNVVVAGNEQKYINRWYTVAILNPAVSPKGWILRVSAGDGDDANAFKLNLVDSKGIRQIGKDWTIYSYELPLCLYGVAENEEVQIRPHPAVGVKRTEIRSFGEEQSTVFVRDIFGETSRLPISSNFMQSEIGDIQNQWGVSVTGSSARINNLVIRSKSDSAVVWEWLPTIVQKPRTPSISINQRGGENCNSIQLQLSDATRRESAGLSPIWFIGDTRVDGDSATFEFPKSGTYNAQVIIPTTGLLFPKYWLNNFTININAAPTAVITGDEEIISPGKTLTLSSHESKDPEGSQLRLQWFINDEYRGDQQTLRFNSLIPGIYIVKLVVDDGASNSPCHQAVDSKTIRVNAQPYVEISSPRILGRSVETKFLVKNEYDSDGDNLSYTWSGTGIVGSNKQRTIIVKHDKAGVNQITLTVNDKTGTTNAVYSTTIEYRVNADPVPAFTLPEQAAPNNPIHLSAVNTMDPDNQKLKFHWSVSDGSELDSPEATLTFDAPGDYTVALQVDDGEGVENSVQSYTRSIHINAPPVPSITAVDRSTSARQIISAENSSDEDQKVLKYTWDFGDGTTGAGKTITHLFQKSGHYSIKLTADDGQKQTNSVQSITHLLVINKYPVAQFSIPTKWEPEKPLPVDGTKSSDPDGEISKYAWLINGKESSSDSIGSLVFAEPGDYAIALKVTDNSGFDDAVGIQTAKIHINYPPVIKWKKSPDVTEENETVTFDAKGTFDPDGKIKNVTWRFPDNTVLNGMKVTRVFKNSGMMNVKISADDGAGYANSVQTRNFNILVNNKPIIVTKTIIRSNSQVVLLDGSQSYDIDGHALKFDWLLSDGTHRNEASFNWKAPKGGVHFITLTVDDGQGKKNSIARETVRLIVNRPPVAVVDSLIYSCTGMTILLNGSLSHDPDSDPITANWDFGDGTSSTETNPAHVFTKPGFYSVKLYLSDGFAEQPTTATIPVIIEGSPQAFQGFIDTTICVNTSLTFDGTRSNDPNGPLGSYSWDFGDGINALGSVVTHAYSKPGTYYVTLTVVGNGSGRCSRVNQATSTIHVVEGPTAEFSLPEAVSIGEEITVDASTSHANGKILTTSWEARSGDVVINKEGSQTQFKFEKPGLYAVRLTITIETSTNCNSSSIVRNVRVNAPPVLAWDIPKDIALGDLLMMDGSKSYDPDGIITEFSWSIDGKKIGSTPIISIPIAGAGEHAIGLSITDNSGTSSCSISQTTTIRVNTKPDPIFAIPDPVYESETIKLEPGRLTDSDNDQLSFSWKIDGTSSEPKSVVLTPGKHTITLIANDGRGLKNSVDSIQKDIFVTPKPDLKSIDFPKDWLMGGEMNISEIIDIPGIGFIIDLVINKVWLAQVLGDQTVAVGWAPRNQIITQENFGIYVWPLLEFLNPPQVKTIQWNPSNPSTVLTAPEVNRPETRRVTYEWRKDKTLIGYGKMIEAPLNIGVNVFNLRAIDQNMVGARAVETEIIVNCE
jgi:PKD repeat protein